MTYVIAEPCVDVQDKACIDVCPVDCIYEIPDDGNTEHGGVAEEGRKSMLYIHPEECIDCGACEPECDEDAGCAGLYCELVRRDAGGSVVG